MSREFSPNRRTSLRQSRLHKDVADSTFDRHSASFGDCFSNTARRTKVINHRSAWRRFERFSSKSSKQKITTDRRAAFIDDHATICVAVEAHTKVHLSCDDRSANRGKICLDEWIGFVHEFARTIVEIDRLNLEARNSIEHFGRHRPSHSVACINRNAQSTRTIQNRWMQQTQKMIPICFPQIDLFFSTSATLNISFFAFLGILANHFQSAASANRLRMNSTDLESVVLRWIVARRHFNPTSTIEMIDCEICHRRVDHSNIDYMCAEILNATLECVRQ